MGGGREAGSREQGLGIREVRREGIAEGKARARTGESRFVRFAQNDNFF